MPTYLTHSEHGTHIAYLQTEVDACLKNGWKVREEDAPALDTPHQEPTGVAVAKRKYARKVK